MKYFRWFCLIALCIVAPYRLTSAQEVRLIAIGGSEGHSSASTTLRHLKTHLKTVDAKNAVVVFTGNYSSQPMPSKNDPNRLRIETEVKQHIDAIKDFYKLGGQVYFLLGHKDAPKGRKSPRRLKKFINKQLKSLSSSQRKPNAMPHPDCGEPAVIILPGHNILAIINSQWWFGDWHQHTRTNEGCEFKKRSELVFSFEAILKKYRNQRLIFALHHPLESLGEYGGHFKAIEHLNPPIIGTLKIWAKQNGLIPQFRSHPLYASLSNDIKGRSEKYGSFIFISGHEKNLQLLKVGTQTQIISGTSSQKTMPVIKSQKNEFSHRAGGWAQLTLRPDGAATAQFVEGIHAEQLFEIELPKPTSIAKQPIGFATSNTSTTTRSLYSRRNPGKTSFFGGMFFGRHYRNAYTLNLQFETLNLELAGLKPVKIGGGAQTNSLRLMDSQGGQWAMRATTKDASRWLPYPMNQVPFINHLLEDGFTATHPAAALAVPPLAKAIGIYHTKPRLLYLPDQHALEEYRGYITNEVVLLERRPKAPKQGVLPQNLAGTSSVTPTKYRSTLDMIDRIKDNPSKHQIDQEMMLRARLLDIFLGDWDRHEDQWRFAVKKQKDKTILYQPIPRDRDQVFANYDGLLLAIGRIAVPDINLLGTFNKTIDNVKWLTYNARFIDPIFLNKIDKKRWMQIAREVQSQLTNDVIASALARWPKEVYDLDGAEIESKLRARRNDLLSAAETFFKQVNRNTVLLGSNKDDIFELLFLDNNRIALRILTKKAKKLYFYRIYTPENTKELRIYGLDGDDRLIVSGNPHSKIKVRFIGGPGDDIVKAKKKKPVTSYNIAVYDRPKGLKIKKSIKVSDKRSRSAYRNQYDLHDPHHEPSKYGFIPSFEGNPDDDLFIGTTANITFSGFKRKPFASSHQISASFATSTLGAKLYYKGLFPESFMYQDQEFNLEATSPTYTRNFFGITNTYIDPKIQSRQFYQVKQSQLSLRYGLARSSFSDLVRYGVKGLGRFIDTQATPNRFVVISNDIQPQVLQNRYFIGGQAFMSLDTRDNKVYPKQGLIAEVSSKIQTDVSSDRPTGTSVLFEGLLGTHLSFDRSQRLTLSSNFRAAGIIGSYPFYFAPTLGDRDLRAYNDEQLAGNGVFAHSSDLRFEVVRIRHVLPSTIGMAASFDHGRAFGPDIVGNNYHAIVGGTVFWNILGAVGLRVSYYHGLRNEQRFVFGLGSLFERGSIL